MNFKMPQGKINKRESYAVIDEDGKIIDTFRLKITATENQRTLQKIHRKPLKVLPLK